MAESYIIRKGGGGAVSNGQNMYNSYIIAQNGVVLKTYNFVEGNPEPFRTWVRAGQGDVGDNYLSHNAVFSTTQINTGNNFTRVQYLTSLGPPKAKPANPQTTEDKAIFTRLTDGFYYRLSTSTNNSLYPNNSKSVITWIRAGEPTANDIVLGNGNHFFQTGGTLYNNAGVMAYSLSDFSSTNRNVRAQISPGINLFLGNATNSGYFTDYFITDESAIKYSPTTFNVSGDNSAAWYFSRNDAATGTRLFGGAVFDAAGFLGTPQMTQSNTLNISDSSAGAFESGFRIHSKVINNRLYVQWVSNCTLVEYLLEPNITQNRVFNLFNSSIFTSAQNRRTFDIYNNVLYVAGASTNTVRMALATFNMETGARINSSMSSYNGFYGDVAVGPAGIYVKSISQLQSGTARTVQKFNLTTLEFITTEVFFTDNNLQETFPNFSLDTNRTWAWSQWGNQSSRTTRGINLISGEQSSLPGVGYTRFVAGNNRLYLTDTLTSGLPIRRIYHLNGTFIKFANSPSNSIFSGISEFSYFTDKDGKYFYWQNSTGVQILDDEEGRFLTTFGGTNRRLYADVTNNFQIWSPSQSSIAKGPLFVDANNTRAVLRVGAYAYIV